jgi:hypothetical protein
VEVWDGRMLAAIDLLHLLPAEYSGVLGSRGSMGTEVFDVDSTVRKC